MPHNAHLIERFQRSEPRLIRIARAGDVLPWLDEVSFLHAGPPIEVTRVPGPMAGALTGALVLEGHPQAEAEHLLSRGLVRLRPCHDAGFVGPMAGIVSRSMPVWVVRDAVFGNQSYATLNEGLGRALRFGAFDAPVLARLSWISTVLAPVLDDALSRRGPLDLKPFLAEGLRRGDELHNRNKATTAAFVREFAPHIAAAAATAAEPVFEFLRTNDHFCLNLSIAASKCSSDAAHALGDGSVVTAMAANGREFGIRVSGLGDRWCTAPAGRARGRYFEGFGESDSCRDMGDSYVSEVVGLGGLSLAAAPAIASFIGGRPSEFPCITRQMYEITLSEHEQFRIPALDFRGAPLGIEVGRVVETGILPILNSGIAHKAAGVGQIGAGITHPPMACFQEALQSLEARIQGSPATCARSSRSS